MANTEPTIGVLSLHTSKETKAILNAIEALGYRGEWLTTENPNSKSRKTVSRSNRLLMSW